MTHSTDNKSDFWRWKARREQVKYERERHQWDAEQGKFVSIKTFNSKVREKEMMMGYARYLAGLLMDNDIEFKRFHKLSESALKEFTADIFNEVIKE